ncbi:hypothetical protein DY000_02040354 [Brassica cretica]|uniref:Uncharacterized protein n=1 Tax=Brassica cretica TaxID=69181 RepID=A0ABQ7BRE4_BRACR|nr:hypothetical protein DY000_02040354 [Brassica cretica]
MFQVFNLETTKSQSKRRLQTDSDCRSFYSSRKKGRKPTQVAAEEPSHFEHEGESESEAEGLKGQGSEEVSEEAGGLEDQGSDSPVQSGDESVREVQNEGQEAREEIQIQEEAVEEQVAASIDTEPRDMVAPLILVRDNNGDLHDQEGHLRNAAGQSIDAQGAAILEPGATTAGTYLWRLSPKKQGDQALTMERQY